MANALSKPGAAKPVFSAVAAENSGTFSRRDWFLFGAMATIWGSSFLLIAIGLESLHPGFVTSLRVTLGAAALATVSRPLGLPERSDRLRVAALSVVWVGIPFTLFPLAEQHINSAITGLLNGGVPIFVAVISTVFVKQAPKGAQLTGILIGFFGVLLVSWPSLGEGSSQATGVAMVVSATLCYGFAMNLAPPLQRTYGSLKLMAWMLILASMWTLPYGLWGLSKSSMEVRPLLAVAVLGVAGTGLAFVLLSNLVGSVGSTRASFINYVIPVVSLTLGVVFYNDEVAPITVVGCGFVLVGASLASRKSAKAGG